MSVEDVGLSVEVYILQHNDWRLNCHDPIDVNDRTVDWNYTFECRSFLTRFVDVVGYDDQSIIISAPWFKGVVYCIVIE